MILQQSSHQVVQTVISTKLYPTIEKVKLLTYSLSQIFTVYENSETKTLKKKNRKKTEQKIKEASNENVQRTEKQLKKKKLHDNN